MSTEKKAVVAFTGSGGREDVQLEAYLASCHVDKVLVIPGNDMMKKRGGNRVITFPGVKTDQTNIITQILRDYHVTHFDPSQDNAVQAGTGDLPRLFCIKVMGPTSAAGRLEWDKEYARNVGDYVGILQPDWIAFSTIEEATRWLENQPDKKRFVKAAGLAEGKGSIGADTKEDVLNGIRRLKEEHPRASERFLIETALIGEEFSTFIVSDGEHFQIVGNAQDHKREYDGDLGENTGGMGAVSNPLVMEDVKLQEGVVSDVRNILTAKIKEGNPYRGWLYYGGIVVPPEQLNHLIEWNARQGDPEAQAIIPGLNVDLFELGDSIASGDISKLDLKNDGKIRLVVTIASRGYPRDYSAVKGKEIRSLAELSTLEGVSVYGAGVRMEEGKPYIAGGRLFYLVAAGANILEAKEKLVPALEIVREMDGEYVHFREDIGWRDVARLRNRTNP